MRWRLIGAWRWPLFLVLTVADALIIRALPPAGTRALFFVPARRTSAKTSKSPGIHGSYECRTK